MFADRSSGLGETLLVRPLRPPLRFPRYAGVMVGTPLVVFAAFEMPPRLFVMALVAFLATAAFTLTAKRTDDAERNARRPGKSQMALTLANGRITYTAPDGSQRLVATAGDGGHVVLVRQGTWRSGSLGWIWCDAAGRETVRITLESWPARKLERLREAVGYPLERGAEPGGLRAAA